MLKLVSVPLLDLLVLPGSEEQMSLGDELEKHDTGESGEDMEMSKSLKSATLQLKAGEKERDDREDRALLFQKTCTWFLTACVGPYLSS